MSNADTIYALASGSGVTAISVIRISGSRAREAMLSLVGRELAVRRANLCRLAEPGSGQAIDEAIVIWTPGPRSFTGEDCLELQIHGSRAIQSKLFAMLSSLDGFRMAEAGEFARRAVANGKMDLVQAEGLGDLLVARTEAQHRQALAQAFGGVSAIFDSWREQLLLIRAHIEAALDFADEDGVAEEAGRRVDSEIRLLLRDMEGALRKADMAESIRDGIMVVLAGVPNTGKSSLLNAIAARDAAIVSHVAGTTRDVIEVFLDLGGMPVVLTDTAGLRHGVLDVVEAEGIRRTRGRLAEADIVVWVASPDIPESERYDGEISPDILVIGKQDLELPESRLSRNDSAETVMCRLSVATGAGVMEFVKLLEKLVAKRMDFSESAVIVSRRQRDATSNSIRALNDSLSLDSEALELKAECVRQAADWIGRLTGRIEVEEWLGAIFSRFCIGK